MEHRTSLSPAQSLLGFSNTLLSGSQFGANVISPYASEGKSGAGHMVIAINIEAFRSLAEFNSDMEHMISTIKSAPRRRR